MKINHEVNKSIPTYNIPETAVRLREIRKRCGLTQEQAAGQLSIERKTLSAIERGVRGCSVDLFIRMSAVYNVSTDYLLMGKKDELDFIKGVLEKARDSLTLALESL